jgi:hypothetical protein
VSRTPTPFPLLAGINSTFYLEAGGASRRFFGAIQVASAGAEIERRAIVSSDYILILLETEDIGDHVIRLSLREDEVGHIPMG